MQIKWKNMKETPYLGNCNNWCSVIFYLEKIGFVKWKPSSEEWKCLTGELNKLYLFKNES